MSRTEQHMATILTDIMSAWKRQPDQRLAQLLVNAARSANLPDDIFHIEDEKLSKIVLEFVND